MCDCSDRIDRLEEQVEELRMTVTATQIECQSVRVAVEAKPR